MTAQHHPLWLHESQHGRAAQDLFRSWICIVPPSPKKFGCEEFELRIYLFLPNEPQDQATMELLLIQAAEYLGI